MQNLSKQLAEICGSENVFTDPADIIACSRQHTFNRAWSRLVLPAAVLRPRNLESLRRLTAFCGQEGLKIRIRGAGSLPVANSSDASGEVLLLTTGLDRILEIDRENRTANVQCGVTCKNLADAAAAAGLFYPPDPGSLKICTIGGNIAANAAGFHSCKYGPTGIYLRSVEIVDGRGESLTFMAQNGLTPEPGLPLAHLFCGSYGMLGIICRAELTLLPRPKSRKGLLAEFADISAAAEAAKAMLATVPSMLEIMDAASMQALQLGKKAALLVDFDGCLQEVEENINLARKTCTGIGVSSLRLYEEADLENVLSLCCRLPIAFSNAEMPFHLQEVACPVSGLPELVRGIARICDSHKLRYALYGHAGTARIHTVLYYQDEAALREACREIFTLELILNRLMADEADAGLERGQWRKLRADADNVSGGLRKLFDPVGIFSPQYTLAENCASQAHGAQR